MQAHNWNEMGGGGCPSQILKLVSIQYSFMALSYGERFARLKAIKNKSAHSLSDSFKTTPIVALKYLLDRPPLQYYYSITYFVVNYRRSEGGGAIRQGGHQTGRGDGGGRV